MMINKIKSKIISAYRWTKSKILYILIGGVVLASGGAMLPKDPSMETHINNLQNTILTDLQPNEKYKRRDKEIKNGIEYEVHEYETSKGEIGYTIFITKEKDNKIYKKAISTGVEKVSREFDWRIIQDNTPIIIDEVATSTTQ